MPIKSLSAAMVFGLLLVAAVAQEEDDTGAEPQQQETERGSSSRRRSLPEDDFRPSERVSEDYPVPFPTDI